MSIPRRIRTVVLNVDTFPITFVPAGAHADAAADRGHGRAGGRRIVGAVVRTVDTKDRVEPVEVEAGGDAERAFGEGRSQELALHRVAFGVVEIRVLGSLDLIPNRDVFLVLGARSVIGGG